MKKSDSTSPAAYHHFEARVYIHDTDCYGVVWHGHYLRWLEIGRCQLLEHLGFVLQPAVKASEAEDACDPWLYPVVEQHLKYKQFARLNDTLTIHTTLINKEPRLVFEQTITRRGYRIREREENNENERNIEPEKLCLQAATTCVVLEAGTQKLLRRLPTELKTALGWL